jgi:IclR family KDG regulon transcriptional repressor
MLHQETQETVHVAQFLNNKVVYVFQLPSDLRVRVATTIGSTAPVHATASGKAVVAFLPSDTMQVVLNEQGGFVKYTAKTIMTARRLQKELCRVRANGFAVDDREYDDEVRCVAAPILAVDNRPIGSVGISAPATRVNRNSLDALAHAVLRAATRFAVRLGFNGRSQADGGTARVAPL